MDNELSRRVDALPGLVWTAFPDGRIEFVNRRWCEYTGLSVEEASDDGWQTAFHPDDRAALLETWRVAVASNAPGEAQARMRRVDGVYRWFLCRVNPVTDGAGKVVTWCGINTDIEERKQAEDTARANEQRLQLVVDGFPTQVLIFSPAGEVLHANRCFFDYFGVTLSELKQWQTNGLTHPDDREAVIARFRESMSNGKPYDGESRHRRADGVCRWFRVQGVPLRDKEGRIALWYFLQRDIDDRVQTEAHLGKSAALMAKVEQLSLRGSFSWRPTTGSITWSEQLYRMFGIEPGAQITMDTIAAGVHPDDLHLLHEMIERAQDGKDVEFDHRLLLPNGSVKYVHIQAHATRDVLGQLDYVGAVQDVTERRRSEDALACLRAELIHVCRVNSMGELTASIAHEISQPLTGMTINAGTSLRLLSAEPPKVEGALEAVRRTIRDGRRASEVMKRLRARFNNHAVKTDAVDLSEAAREVTELLRDEIREKRIVLQLKAADDLPPVAGDRVQLQQVVVNLLLNAVQAMNEVDDRPRQMLITIEREDGDCVRLAVTDSGVGFDPQYACRLFDAFYTTTRDGMGIGLSVSRRIIENHGGRLWATPNERFGATFSFVVPSLGDHPANAGPVDRI
ncbi:PAS domain-containing sensor histidine kinase [Paraburkholderia guartelaensis]|uniref:histidine kinase n=1 Tax=Paraburkholderia guartelaensis TaxID=2546446 RepID=A0A4R5L7U8_9BURK|nr:PAS domain-containing sensor histidine kinase [Paraburkholderia guartelaensis]TDG04521.1 PAS domain-containing sensor histidine kinase [Paraburkholderia guartelaensis]